MAAFRSTAAILLAGVLIGAGGCAGVRPAPASRPVAAASRGAQAEADMKRELLAAPGASRERVFLFASERRVQLHVVLAPRTVLSDRQVTRILADAVSRFPVDKVEFFVAKLNEDDSARAINYEWSVKESVLTRNEGDVPRVDAQVYDAVPTGRADVGLREMMALAASGKPLPWGKP